MRDEIDKKKKKSRKQEETQEKRGNRMGISNKGLASGRYMLYSRVQWWG